MFYKIARNANNPLKIIHLAPRFSILLIFGFFRFWSNYFFGFFYFSVNYLFG